jgi:cytochrome bd ubiquinol oxidase subunit I
MNWSAYSRFVGDIFGAPLALEGLLAFFLESTFLGLWIFGWDRLSPKLHLATIWLAATGTVLSAYFILAANSFMQNPVGFTFNEARGRAELTDFAAVLTNPVVLITFPHQIFGCFMVGGAFVAAVAGWHLWKINKGSGTGDRIAFRAAVKLGAITLLIAGLGIIVTGDIQGKVMTQVQPMKMASAEALFDTEQPASFSVITIGTPDGQHELWAIKIPNLLSFLAEGNFHGEVKGIRELQQAYEQTYGPGTYSPNIPLTYWSFRWMIGLGLVGMATGAWLLFSIRRGRSPSARYWPALLIALPLLPLFANSFGWIFTETGRQPWLVFGLLTTTAGVSPNNTVGEVLTSMIAFTALYGTLAVVEVRLMLKYIREGLPDVSEPELPGDSDADAPMSFAY